MNIADLQPKERQEIEENLERFGLNDKERSAYLHLLAMGQVTLSPIAKSSGLKLTTVQSVMARLADRGLIKVTKRGSRSLYEALDPVVMRRLLERQIEEAAAVIPMLQKLQGDPVAPARLRVYSRERMEDLLHLAIKSKGKLIHEIVAAKDFQEVIGERFHFTSRRVKAGVRLRSLRVESREIKRYSAAIHARELREARFLPRDLTFRSSVMFWDDTVAFMTTKDEGLAWLVKSRVMAETYQQLFDLLWSVSKKMETL